MFKIILSAILFSSLSFAYGPVLKTGQTKSYDENGNVVTDGSVKDDGYYQAGEARSYTRYSMGIVKDNVTGLEWQDDVDSVSSNWDEAQSYCHNLTLAGGQWRLPTIEELETLVDDVQHPSVESNLFEHITSSRYWSSTLYADDNSSAWSIQFGIGTWAYGNKGNNLFVRCVRGEQLYTSNFSRNDSSGIVVDNATGLQWQDNYKDNGGHIKDTNWTEAIAYCENLSLGGYTDWRLPNIKELLSITDHLRSYPAISPVFQYINSYDYWSSTTYSDYTFYAWFVYFSLGGAEYDLKSNSGYVRCVRGTEELELKEKIIESIENLYFDDIVKLYRGGYYAVGGKDIYFSDDGEKFTKYPIAYEEGTSLTVYNAIEVNRDNEVVAVGDGGLFAYKHGGYNTGFTVAADRDYDYLDITADWNNFVIVGSDGLIRSVSPGSIGNRIDVGTTHDIVAITYNFNTESFYAVTNGGEFIKGAMEDKQDYYQFDSLTWSKKTIAPGIALTSVAADYVNEQVRIVVVGEGGKIYYSNDDGATFHESTSPSSEGFLGVKVVNGNFIAATAHGLYRSSDGINWVAADTESFSSSQINVITVDDGVLYVMTSDGVRRFSDFANIESGQTKKVTLGGVTVEFENSTVTFTDGKISSFDIEGGDTMYILKDDAPIAKIVLGSDATFTQYSENNSTLASILYKEQAYVEIGGDNTLYYHIGGGNYKPVSEGAFWLKDGKVFEKPMFTTVSDQHKETFHSYIDAYINNQYTSRYNGTSDNLRKILLSPDNMRTLMHGMVELMSLYSKKLEEFPNTANDLLLGRTDSIFSPLQVATPYFRKLYLDTDSGKIKMSDAYMFLPQIGTGFIDKIIQNKDISAMMPKLSCEVKGSQIKGVVKDLTIDIGPFQIYGKKAEVQSSLNDNEKKESIEIDEAGFTLKTPLCSNDYTQCAAQRANIGSKVSSLKLEYDGEHYQMLSGEAGANFAFPPLQLTDKILLTDVAGYMNFKFRDPDTSGIQVYNDPYSDELDNPLYLVGGQGKLIYKRNNYSSITFDGKLDLMFGINSFDTSSIDMQNLYHLGLGVHDFPRFPRAGVFSVKGISGAYQYNKYGGDYWSLGGDLSFYSVGDGASALFAGHANFTVSSTFENWGVDLTSLRTKIRGTDFNLDWMHGGGACFFYGNNIHSNFPVTCPSITNCLGQDFGLMPKGDEIFNGLGTGIKVNMAINKGNKPYEMLGFEFANILTGDLAAKFIDESTKKNTTLDLMVRTEVNLPKVKDKNSWLYKILPSDIRDGKNLGTACVSFSTYKITQTDTGVFYDTDYNLGKHWGFYIIAGSGDHKYKLFIPTDKLLDKDKKQLLYMVDMKIQNTAITSRNVVKRAVGDTVNDSFSATGNESLIKFDLSSSNPDLTITTPDGTVLDQNTQSSGDIEVSQKDGEYCVITIYNPSAGSYDIQYTSTGDEQLRVFGANQEPDATLSLSGNTFEFGLNDVDNDPMEYTIALLDENNNSVAELKREDNVSNGDYTYDIPNITYLPTGDYRVALYYKDAYSPMKRLTSVSTIRLTKSILEISNIQTLVTKAFTYVSWDTIEGVDGYNISLYNDYDEKLYDYNTTVSSFRFFDLSEGNYTAQIYAYDDQNNTNSVVTNTFEVAKITNVQTPIAIDDIAVNFDNDNTILSWSSSGADYYLVDIFQNGAELLSDFVTTDTQLSLDNSYKAQTVTVTVRAMNVANEAADPFSKQLIVVDPYDGDGDGMSDMWETYYLQSLSQTADGDYDGDGLTNGDEYSLKTNPSKVDTDGDHIADADDPDPLMKADRNSNYVADDWETFYGIDDILGDKDADGYANYIEYFAGMNPLVADPAGIDTSMYTDRSYAPVVVSNIEPLSMVGLDDSVTIDLSNSFDLNGDALQYAWKVNAKEVTGYTSPIFTVDTSTTGMKRIEVTVKDSNSSTYRQFAVFVTDGQHDRVEAGGDSISLNKFSISIPSAAMKQRSYLVAGDISQAQIPVDIMGREIASDGLVYLYSEGAELDAPVTITPYMKDDDIVDPYVFNYESSIWTNLVTGETFDPIFRTTVLNSDQNYTISTRETGILVFAKKPEKVDLENVTHITDTGRVYTIDLEQFKAEHNLTRILDVHVGDTDAFSARYGVVNGNDEIRLEVYGEGIGRITIIGYDENNVKVSYTYFIDIDTTSNQGIEKPKGNRANLVPIINYLLF